MLQQPIKQCGILELDKIQQHSSFPQCFYHKYHYSVYTIGNQTRLSTNPSILDFTILKDFRVHTHLSKTPQIQEVFWRPLMHKWIKCNTNGSSMGNPIASSCVGIFRDNAYECISCFAANISIQNSLFAELMGTILAVTPGIIYIQKIHYTKY